MVIWDFTMKSSLHEIKIRDKKKGGYSRIGFENVILVRLILWIATHSGGKLARFLFVTGIVGEQEL